jgi:Protein of unknown function (DUF2612)/Concanavalin A-like lectin/glucanases superfamily
LSGPPYPHPNPVSGSNAIGEFQIGVSPIGTIPPFDYWKTVISQYGNSSAVTQLLTNFFQYVDQTANLDSFFDNIWNIDTAQGAGLDLWGRIIGVIRTVFVPSSNKYFGFEEATTISADPFNVSPFFSGQPLTNNFALSDTAFRLLLLAKALSNISDGSIKSINQILINLFPGRGNAYAVDGVPDGVTKLLLHCNGPIGSTNFLDSSSVGNVVTAQGNASIAGKLSEFNGPTVAVFDGVSSSLSIPSSSNFTPVGDYTIDFWVWLNGTVGIQGLFSKQSSPSQYGPYVIVVSGNTVLFYASSGTVGFDIALSQVIGTISINAWHHVAVVRSGNNYFTFLDGVAGASFFSLLLPLQTNDPVIVGNAIGGVDLSGYMSEIRFSSKALWTSGFTPPTGPASGVTPMTMEYFFTFSLSAVELAVLGQSGVLPKPVGVAASVVETL